MIALFGLIYLARSVLSRSAVGLARSGTLNEDFP